MKTKTSTTSTEFVTIDRFDEAIQSINKRFDEVETRLDEMNKRFDEVLNKFDDFVGQFQEMKIELTVLPHQVTEVQDMTGDHEKRITILEHDTKTL